MGGGFPERLSSGAGPEWVLFAVQDRLRLQGRVLSLPAQRSRAQLSSLLVLVHFTVTGLTLPIPIEQITR